MESKRSSLEHEGSSLEPINKTFSEVWLMRHGERIDETRASRQWYCSVPPSRHFDPDLTTVGVSQAIHAAETLVRQRSGRPGFHRIYVSPLSRTLSTASAVANTLGITEVVVVPGLSQCAAAVQREGLDFWETLDFLSIDAMQQLCPQVTRIETRAPRAFDECVSWIVEVLRDTPDEPFLLVTHREGIRDLMGCHVRLPYCALALFTFDQDKDAETKEDTRTHFAVESENPKTGSNRKIRRHLYPRSSVRSFTLKHLLAPTGNPISLPLHPATTRMLPEGQSLFHTKRMNSAQETQQGGDCKFQKLDHKMMETTQGPGERNSGGVSELPGHLGE